MSFSNHLYLLFLLLIILLAFLSKAVRRYAARVIYEIARVANRAAPTTDEVQLQPPIPIMSENDRWKAIIRESNVTIENYLIPITDIELASLIRCITFRVFLVVFLGVDPDKFAFTNVQLVTTALSEFYQEQSELPSELEGILDEWLPPQRFPSSLDRILPAYEVLWRITATLVVTCEEQKALRWVMMDFRDNPRDRQYRTCLDPNGRSVSAITDDVVNRLRESTHLPPVAVSNWPLDYIQDAPGNSWTAGQPPTVHEALKFAALLASMVVGLAGVPFGISNDDMMDSQAPPWGARRIFRMNSPPQAGHVAINVLPLSHASTSNQDH